MCDRVMVCVCVCVRSHPRMPSSTLSPLNIMSIVMGARCECGCGHIFRKVYANVYECECGVNGWLLVCAYV